MVRGEIWWAQLSEPMGSEPGYRRPILIIQADAFNKSNINTIICAVITSNLALSEAPGNVFLPEKDSNLPKSSVINVSQVITISKLNLTECVGAVSKAVLAKVDNGLRLVLDV